MGDKNLTIGNITRDELLKEILDYVVGVERPPSPEWFSVDELYAEVSKIDSTITLDGLGSRLRRKARKGILERMYCGGKVYYRLVSKKNNGEDKGEKL